MTAKNYDLDLDDLVDKTRVVKLNGNLIELHPVDLESLFKIQKIYVGMSKSDSDSPDDILKNYEQLRSVFIELVPELENEKFTINQLFKIIEIIVEMATPTQTAELKKQGISPAGLSDDQKKAVGASLKKSGVSATTTRDILSKLS